MADPEMDPMPALAITAALAGPPGFRPVAAKARSMKNLPAPVFSRKRAEQDEHEHICRGHPKRQAEDAFLPKVKLAHQAVDAGARGAT